MSHEAATTQLSWTTATSSSASPCSSIAAVKIPAHGRRYGLKCPMTQVYGQFSSCTVNQRGLRCSKRKLLDDKKSMESSEDYLCGFLQPLYCKVCHVTLNAPAQAKQHYDGKSHTKKMKMFMDGDEDPEQAGKKKSAPEIPSEIYCKICGVSFNSSKQAAQHYQGKNHGKKMRASHAATNLMSAENPNAVDKVGSQFVCRVHVTPHEQLDRHIEGNKHYSNICVQDNGTTARLAAVPQSLLGKYPSSIHPGRGMFLPRSNQAMQVTIPAKRPTRDLQNFRTPSGNYYCSACNITLNSDLQMSQHIDSKKHRTNHSLAKNKTLSPYEQASC